MKKILYTLSIAALSLFSTSCDSFIDLEPIDYPTENTFYKDVKGLEGAVIGLYDGLQANQQYGHRFQALMEIRGDNVKDDNSGAAGGVRYQISTFTETPSNTYMVDVWSSTYSTILGANLILQSTPEVEMSDAVRTKIEGQASFIRGLTYFNLVRLWGKVPLVTKIQTVEEARENTRDEISLIYSQIENDLKAAKALPQSWDAAEKGRATSLAASALLAKVYLYQKKYNEALIELKPLVEEIKKGSLISLVPMDKTFPNDLKTSKDILFAVQYLRGGVGESAHQNNRYRNNDNGNVITLPQSEFENGDIRKAMVAPTGSGQRPAKFNAPSSNNETSSDFPVIRCAEVMLMYAEVLNELADTPSDEAFDALNRVRNNAGLASKTIADYPDKDTFRAAVYKERRLELALECDRWFDIVRTGQFKAVNPKIDEFRQLYPIPQTEIENVNNKDGWQNEGYSIAN